jgi:hypothetical protein
MDIIYNPNPAASVLDFQNSINERLIKTKAITACLLLLDKSYHEPSNSMLHDAIWAIDDYLEEIMECQTALSNLKGRNKR